MILFKNSFFLNKKHKRNTIGYILLDLARHLIEAIINRSVFPCEVSPVICFTFFLHSFMYPYTHFFKQNYFHTFLNIKLSKICVQTFKITLLVLTWFWTIFINIYKIDYYKIITYQNFINNIFGCYVKPDPS